MTEYQLHHGDCLDILPALDQHSIDAVICDIPSGRTRCAWDSVIPFDAMWSAIRHVAKPKAAIVLLGCTQPFTSALIMSNVEQFKYTWVWEKSTPTGFLDANRRPLRAHEDIAVFSDGQTTYNPQKVKGPPNHRRKPNTTKRRGVYGAYDAPESDISGMKYPRSVLRFDKHSSSESLHENQKPLALLEYLIRTYTNAGDTVLDFCYGSGTTGAACGNLGRRFVGVERDRAYFDQGASRIAEAYEPLRAMQQAAAGGSYG